MDERQRNIILFGGLPGSGKTTTAKALIDVLSDAKLVSSEGTRERYDLREILNLSARPELHERLAEEIALALETPTIRNIIVDANMLESYARFQLAKRFGSNAKIHFIAPRAPFPVIVQRTKSKFGTKPFFDAAELDYSTAIDHCIMLMTPIFEEEARTIYASVVQIDTDSGLLRTWSKAHSEDQTVVSGIVRAYSKANLALELGGPIKLLKTAECSQWRASASGCIATDAGTRRIVHREARTSAPHDYADTLRRQVGSDPLILPGVRAVISDGSSIVLVHRALQQDWGIPSGGLEIGESIDECLAREVFEETGLVVDSAELVDVQSGRQHLSKDFRGDFIQKLSFVYRIDAYSGDLKSNCDEIDDVRVFPLTQLPPLATDHQLAITKVQTARSQFART